MSYALFSNATKVSKAFRSKADVWSYAAASGLVIEVRSSEEDPPRRILDMGCTIRECEPDLAEASEAAGLSKKELAQLIAASRVNPPSAAAAS